MGDAIASLFVGGPSFSNDAKQFDKLKLLERRLTAPIGEFSNPQTVAPQNLAQGFDSVAATPFENHAAAFPSHRSYNDEDQTAGHGVLISNDRGSIQIVERNEQKQMNAKTQPISSASKLSRAASDGLGTGSKRRKYISGGAKSPDDFSKGEAFPGPSPGSWPCRVVLILSCM